MNFASKLNETFGLLSELDNVIIKDTGISILKKQLLSLSEDLAQYKDINHKNIKLENNEHKLKIIDVLNKINEIEINVKNKLTISNKYNAYLNS